MKMDKPTPIWSCKIGMLGDCDFPKGSDLPMREAVEKAFKEITGIDCEFNFSGWSAKLVESELAVVENRGPDIGVQMDELRKHEEIVMSGIEYHKNKAT